MITPEPVNPWRILLGDDPTLPADTLALFDELYGRLGHQGYWEWLHWECPMLLEDVPMLVMWWQLRNKLDKLEETKC